ncbi:hypothetical protein A5320_03905 [Rheinheimera sp. SA_1]|uniref:non-ribosomal peptide synthetase n=1 Tax=Rheinheimera sp. SA_1 TaxID=1827365 RepID=UPI0007FE1878|nr:non-ribosomal peptide synthetase [Rheinheimera sp. SA_1]OBP16550.1 hypothetical protein A5320_03905 [Rheinheimera sp. SA_1]
MSIHLLIRELAEKNVHLAVAGETELTVTGGQQQLTADLLAAIRQHKSEILNWLRSRNSEQQPIRKNRVLPAVVPLSDAQQRLWILDKLQGGSAEYHMPLAFSVSGKLDIPRLNQVFYSIIERHAVLRTVYDSVNGEACQRVLAVEQCDFRVEVNDFSGIDANQQTMLVQQSLIEAASRPFDLSRDLMLRVLVLQQSLTEAVVLITMHHIASDGWSVAVLLKEFLALYQAEQLHSVNPLPPLELQYADYAIWQRQQEISVASRDYWQQQLTGLPETHGLSLARPRTQFKAYQGALVSDKLGAASSQQLLKLAAKYQLTPFMLLHGILALLLSRHSYSHDIVIGTSVANRVQPELNDLIGFFVNTLVLRLNTEQPSLHDFIDHLRQVHRDALTYQLPFEDLVKQSQISRSSSISPLFQILMTYNSDFGVLASEQHSHFSLPGLQLKLIPSGHYQAKYDLTVEFQLNESGLQIHWLYDVAIFDEVQIRQLNQHFCQLALSVADSGGDNRALESLDMLNTGEIEQLLYGWNQTTVRYPEHLLIHQLFEQQALLQPSHIAVRFEDDSLTYQQLNEQANQLAHLIAATTPLAADTLIGIYAHRSLGMVVAILAVLKAGAAYVPLDPEYPVERLHNILLDAAIPVVLTQTDLMARLQGYTGVPLLLNGCEAVLSHMPKHNPGVAVQPNQLAYVIYTSGSTGKPKGVMIEHGALLNRILWMDHQYGATSADRVLQKTPFSFDVSVWEFVWTLSKGATLIVAKPDGHKDPAYLAELIRQEKVTKLHFVPSMLGLMLEHGGLQQCDSLRQVFCSGEALISNHVEAFRRQLPSVALHNLYGPTEAAIDVSYWDCAGDVTAGVPIGRPIANIQLLILDPQLCLVPDGTVGELCIGGVGLARGYLNRPELTAERFIANPYYQKSRADSSRLLYRTGDLVSRRADGNIEYHGRTDFQLKIRGFRIEPGEVEHQLTQLPGIESAVVLGRMLSGSQQLVAYVKADSWHKGMADELRLALSQRLPDYMIPSLIVHVTEWSLTVNGKLDRTALPLPDVALQPQYVAAETAVEESLLGIAAELLQLNAANISVTADFFSLGGYSLLAVKFLLQVEVKLAINLSIQDLFNMGSFRALAAKCETILQAKTLKHELAHANSDELDEVEF